MRPSLGSCRMHVCIYRAWAYKAWLGGLTRRCVRCRRQGTQLMQGTVYGGALTPSPFMSAHRRARNECTVYGMNAFVGHASGHTSTASCNACRRCVAIRKPSRGLACIAVRHVGRQRHTR